MNKNALVNEALNKVILKEEDEKFVSVAQQDDAFDTSKMNTNLYDDPKNLDPDKETEKNKLTSQVIEKIKIHELAKKLGVETKKVLDTAKDARN